MKRFTMLWCCCFAILHQHVIAQQSQVELLAQRNAAVQPKFSETVVYLHTDKDIYLAGEDLWFSASVLNAQLLQLTDLDRILYLELIHREADTAVWKEMYPVNKGIAYGQVYLSPQLAPGTYLLKAYTSRSFVSGQSVFYSVAPIQIVRDLRSIQRAGEPISALPQQQAKGIRISFHPEGGKLLAGIDNPVVFKATDQEGVPVSITGTLLKNGDSVAAISTSYAGMGQLVLHPDARAGYAVRLSAGADSTYPLPVIEQEGIVLRLERNDPDSLVFRIVNLKPLSGKVYLRLQVRGMLQSIAAAKLTGDLRIALPLGNAASGIAEATLFNEALSPISQRLVFIRQEQRLQISLTGLKDGYGPREKVSLRITTTDPSGKPIPAVVNLRVSDRFFLDPRQVADLVGYTQLTTYFPYPVYNPAGYFDSTESNPAAAMDLLLQTFPASDDYWSEVRMKDRLRGIPLISDSITVQLMAGNRKSRAPVSLMLFNYNKSSVNVVATDSAGQFYLQPEHLQLGRRFFIRYFSDHEYRVIIDNPFDSIHAVMQRQHPTDIFALKNIVRNKPSMDSNQLQYGQHLEEVVVRSTGRGFGDRYLGYLDSIAKFEGNSDFVGQCGWLNCPACGSGAKPVEGVLYSELTEARKLQVTSHPFAFTQTDMRRGPYHYPRYTEEELLRKFKMVMTKGFYEHRAFIHPDYMQPDHGSSDERNTLYWNPVVVTDVHGEATVSFYTSDIRSFFMIRAEGITQEGLTGSVHRTFSTR